MFRRVTVNTIEIKRHDVGGNCRLPAQSPFHHKTGTLEGSVTAKSIAIEKGGLFSGQLAIGQAGLTQGELLPAEAAGAARDTESNVPLSAHPLPAT